MTAATKTKPDTETETFTFTSLRTEYLLNLVPDTRKHNADGTSEPVKGVWAQFGPLGGFEPGTFATTDPELADMLRKSPRFGDDFFEIKVEPVAPDHTDTLIRVATLIASGDLEALFALEAEEREGWAREPILTAIEGAVEAQKARAAAAEQAQE